ncbi:MAG: polysaccharide biosynthesis tyrosine autokinase [Syntrophaceae bacterium]|jgi:protein-tyrosine kinase|nr:polysaccharide biosynthesis tyrosine autokinase [Syntrophaceae bacterium]
MKLQDMKLAYKKLQWLYELWQKDESFKNSYAPKERTRLENIKDKTTWVSPVYHQSRNVRLNPITLEKNRCVAAFADKPETESYKVLREQIEMASREFGGNTVMITSSLRGEGKTMTSINLAFTFAMEFDQTVLLVDCDLKRQNIHQVLGYESDNGLVNFLLNECAITDLIVWPNKEKLTIVSGGKTIDESSEVLGSPWMKNLVTDMKNRYPERYVIFDLPPVLAGADAMIFSQLVDHIVVVVEADKTSMTDLKTALQMLPKDKIRGLILNRVTTPTPLSSYPYQRQRT